METHVFNAVSIDTKKGIPALKKWFKQGTVAVKEEPPPIPKRLKLVLGFPVWGEKYINSFTDICLPSLLAPKNRKALVGSIILIFTRNKDTEYLRKALRPAMDAGIIIDIRTIPEYVMRTLPFHHNNKYWLLGAVEYLSLQIAAKYGFGFHMLMPDFAYSEAYFSNLFRLAKKHEAIAQTCISGKKVPCALELESWRKNGTIEIPARELGDLAFRNMHTITQAILMNDCDARNTLPNCHSLAWIGKDALYIYSCHLNITYMSPQLVRNAPPRLFNPLDTELPRLMPNGHYIPTPKDEMVMVELSGKRDCVQQSPLREWLLSCGMATNFDNGYDRFFAVANIIPIKKQTIFCSDDKRIKTHAELAKLLIATRDVLKKIVKKEQKKHQKLFEAAA